MRGFHAFCRLVYIDPDENVPKQCDATFDDRDQFEQHMAAIHHARKSPTAQPFRRWRPHRTRTLYQPKPLGIGAIVVFAEHREGDATDEIVVRSGQVWSHGPQAQSLWVIPDDGGPAVLVEIRKSPLLTKRTRLDVLGEYGGHRMAVRRIENLRRHGQVFPVVDETRWEYGWHGHKRQAECLSWPTDPDCPNAVGKPAPDPPQEPIPATELIPVLLTSNARWRLTRYCRTCFWLDPAQTSPPADDASARPGTPTGT